ncbi:MAG: IS21-like element helper ATPase IstB [Ignavibacteriaceae bacterium]|nr:IS21-like element helper ATPase IstB [Ignavibacteriaceae bacterium]
MSNIAQLKQQLKSLKLSGTLETIELRLMEATQNQLAFSEMLSMILADELETRRNRHLQRLILNARLESNQTMESFDFTFNKSINATQIRQLATCRFIEKAENVFYIGPTGTGKSHLAKALGHAACRNYLTVGSYNFHELFTLLSQADLSNRLSRILKIIIKYDLLIIDDFAFKKIDQKSAEYLYAITDARYGKGSIILTSNRSMNDWGNIFPDPIMANALMDRLCHNAYQIIIKGESYRRKKNPGLDKE